MGDELPREPESVPTQRSAYYPALDGLRALAVLAVFCVHYLGPVQPYIARWGALGVDCFFVLSGFLITGILYDSRHKKHHLRDFYARRALRIFPLYYGVWLAILVLWLPFRWRWSWPWCFWPIHIGNWARYIFYNPHFMEHLDVLYPSRHTSVVPALFVGHFWSLCVEEQFYLVWPLVVLLFSSRRKLMVVCLGIVATQPLLRYTAVHLLPPRFISAEILWRLTPFRLDGLAFGGFLALAMRGEERRWIARFGRAFTYGSALLAAACVLIQIYLTHSLFFPVTGEFIDTLGLGSFSLFFGAVILELIRENSTLAQALSWTPMRRLGQISYGFYIFHDLFHGVYGYITAVLGIPGFWSTAAVGLCGTLLISQLSFHFFEQPVLRLKRLFEGQQHTAPKLAAE